MRVKYLVSCHGGYASDYSDPEDHHKCLRMAKEMDTSYLLRQFVQSTELAPTNEKKTEEDGRLRLESRTYYEVGTKWVTASELDAMKRAGLRPTVSEIEVFEHPWMDVINHKMVVWPFLAWNVVALAVFAHWGLS